jgi:hypothetical protein
MEPLESVTSRGALRERQARPDVVAEAILLLPDKLEVDASVSVQESREVRTRPMPSLVWPSLGIALIVQLGCDNQGFTDMSRWASTDCSVETQ